MTSSYRAPEVPEVSTLPLDPENGARLVPADGRVTIAGEVWRFRDIRAIRVDPTGRFLVWVEASGFSPGIEVFRTAQVGAVDCTISIGFGGGAESVIEVCEDRPVVLGGLGPAKWGSA